MSIISPVSKVFIVSAIQIFNKFSYNEKQGGRRNV